MADHLAGWAYRRTDPAGGGKGFHVADVGADGFVAGVGCGAVVADFAARQGAVHHDFMAQFPEETSFDLTSADLVSNRFSICWIVDPVMGDCIQSQ